jgi:DNA polymerase I-like protein with 3'-5' exonuclease and polymerase domains
VIKIAMVKIHERLKNTGIIMRLQVHDQLVFEGAHEELSNTYADLCMIMQDAYPPKNGMKLSTDASFSEISFAERDMKKWI